MNSLLLNVLITVSFTAIAYFGLRYGAYHLQEYLPAFKVKIVAIALALVGVVVNIEPSYFIGVFPERYQLLVLILIPIVFDTLKDISAKAGSLVKPEVATVAAAETIAAQPPEVIAAASVTVPGEVETKILEKAAVIVEKTNGVS